MLSKYLSGLVDSKFEDGAGGRGGWSVSPGFPCCVTFYLHDLLSEALSVKISVIDFVSIIIPQTSTCHRIFAFLL